MIETLKSLIFLNKKICYICKSKTDDKRQFFCSDCYENLDLRHEKLYDPVMYFDEMYYSATYNRFMKELIKDFKFHEKNYLSKPLGELLIDTIKLNHIKDIDLILAVPMYRRKESKRGYNQSELLAAYISSNLNIETSKNNLKKIRNTRPQSSLDSLDRKENLKGAFIVKDKEKLMGKKILLIDDIMTTGSTLKECAEVLYKNEVKKIVGVTLVSSEMI